VRFDWPNSFSSANKKVVASIDATGTPGPTSDLVREFAITPAADEFFADEADDLSLAYRNSSAWSLM
jgi:hypothetical protein